MAKFLVVEDEQRIRKQWVQYLENDVDAHEVIAVEDIYDALDAVENSEEEEEPFDLILLDHGLGEKTGLDLLSNIESNYGSDYTSHRVVVMTGEKHRLLATEYAKRGSIGHIIKPLSKDQFWITIDAALVQREIQNKRQDWETALEILEKNGILSAIDKVEAENKHFQEQYAILKSTYDQLLIDLNRAGGKEQEVSNVYAQATANLNSAQLDINSIKIPLQDFEYTQPFWNDVEDIFKHNRIQFFILQNYLFRIRNSPNSQNRKSLAGLEKFYEFRVGRHYRLYFRQLEEQAMILERFGNKNIQEEIIRYLRSR